MALNLYGFISNSSIKQIDFNFKIFSFERTEYERFINCYATLVENIQNAQYNEKTLFLNAQAKWTQLKGDFRSIDAFFGNYNNI